MTAQAPTQTETAPHLFLGEALLPGARGLPSIPKPPVDLDAAASELADATPEATVAWAADTFGSDLALSTSFGIQSAVMLHLANAVVPGIPVVWVDTGYLPEATYRFADELTRRLDLNLHVAEARISPARMEALHGKLWEGSRDDLDTYHRLRKVEPLERTLRELGARALLSGVRADQTDHRATLPRVGTHNQRAKILPLLGWTSRDVHEYLKEHDLPYHPYFEQGYASVGDWHSSRPAGAKDEHERDGRFGGRAQECGLHLELSPEALESLDHSGL
ncbi:MAG: phosphoadenylyl-sulfate reductase [Myxococcales bacterium]|nr:phosphoadenylyl-sulfate reductase [Myxococcales bacterium]